MFAGALTTIPTHAGVALALLTSVAVVATAVVFRDLLMLAVGALGTLLVLPSSVIELFSGELAAPILMLVVGALLVGAGLFIARRRHTEPQPATPTHDFAAAGITGVVVTAMILILAVL